MLEGSTRDFLRSHGTYVFLWIYYLGPALLICLSWPQTWNWRKEGRWHQITALEISSDSRISKMREIILVHLLLLLTPSPAGRQESHTITPLLRVVAAEVSSEDEFTLLSLQVHWVRPQKQSSSWGHCPGNCLRDNDEVGVYLHVSFIIDTYIPIRKIVTGALRAWTGRAWEELLFPVVFTALILKLLPHWTYLIIFWDAKM